MNLYLIRHGKAELNSESGRDFDRSLTQKGRRKIEEISLRLNQLKISFEKIYSSPYLRAKQTAEIIKRHMLAECELEITNTLSPGCNVQSLLENIQFQNDNIALIGHEPDISMLLSDFCGVVNVQLKKGGIAKIVFEGKPQIGAGRLEFLITPKLLK